MSSNGTSGDAAAFDRAFADCVSGTNAKIKSAQTTELAASTTNSVEKPVFTSKLPSTGLIENARFTTQ